MDTGLAETPYFVIFYWIRLNNALHSRRLYYGRNLLFYNTFVMGCTQLSKRNKEYIEKVRPQETKLWSLYYIIIPQKFLKVLRRTSFKYTGYNTLNYLQNRNNKRTHTHRDAARLNKNHLNNFCKNSLSSLGGKKIAI